MTAPSPSSETTVRHPREGLITLAHVIYALHAFSALTGLASSVLVLTAFLTGWPSIIAVILNYAKRAEVRGTWLDSHFGWQIRTFWYALAWLLAGAVAFVTFVGIPVALVVWIATGLWVLYRIARGWMTLSAGKPMPLPDVV
jgi:uncharacterized membrane protein